MEAAILCGPAAAPELVFGVTVLDYCPARPFKGFASWMAGVWDLVLPTQLNVPSGPAAPPELVFGEAVLDFRPARPLKGFAPWMVRDLGLGT